MNPESPTRPVAARPRPCARVTKGCSWASTSGGTMGAFTAVAASSPCSIDSSHICPGKEPIIRVFFHSIGSMGASEAVAASLPCGTCSCQMSLPSMCCEGVHGSWASTYGGTMRAFHSCCRHGWIQGFRCPQTQTLHPCVPLLQQQTWFDIHAQRIDVKSML